MGRIETLEEFKDVTELATKFLICGTLSAKLPYQKVYDVREKNRRLGLGLMGIHEWLIKRGERYEVTPELHRWLQVYKSCSDYTSVRYANALGVSIPVAVRAIAPTGIDWYLGWNVHRCRTNLRSRLQKTIPKEWH